MGESAERSRDKKPAPAGDSRLQQVSISGLGSLGLRNYPENPKYSPNPVLVHSALRSCAAGLLGEDALHIYHMAERSGAFRVQVEGGKPKEKHMQARYLTQNVENLVASLASPRCISALAPFMQHVRSSNRPLAMTRALHTACLAAALWARHEETALHFLHTRHDEELHCELSQREKKMILSYALRCLSDRYSPSTEALAEG